MYDAETVRFLF